MAMQVFSRPVLTTLRPALESGAFEIPSAVRDSMPKVLAGQRRG